MDSLKRKARESGLCLKEEKDVYLTDSALELSVTVGYLGADVKRDEMECLDSLLRDHCVAGMVALERGDSESYLHFQMVVRSRCKNARSFGILVQKYMGWYGRRGMSLVGKVTCKVLTKRYIHTFLGMIGYCLKDAGIEHFEHSMHNISDEDVIVGKTLHTIYGQVDSKKRVTITNKNITDKMFIWFKYKIQRKLTAIFLNTLTNMIQSRIFIPSASWIIPLDGQGMDHKRMTCLWKCIIEPQSVCKIDVQEIFMKKHNFIKGRHFKDDRSPGIDVYDEEGHDSPISVVSRGFVVERKPSSAQLRSALKLCHRSKNVSHVLFQETMEVQRVKKSICFEDTLGDFVALKDNALMIDNEYLNTTNAQFGNGITLLSKLAKNGKLTIANGASDGDSIVEKTSEVINISSDLDEDTIICQSRPKVFLDRTMRMQKAPRYNIARCVTKEELTFPGSQASG